jgi:hypothetical protein
LLPDLYVAGITTGLKANDPLLFVLGVAANQQQIQRIQTVEPDAAANRTKITLQAAAPLVEAPFVRPDVQPFVDHYLDLEARGVAADRAMTQRVTAVLSQLPDELEACATNRQVRQVLTRSLTALRKEYAIATEGQYSRLEPWVGGMVEELNELVEGQPMRRRRGAAVGNLRELNGRNGENGQKRPSALAGLYGFLPAAAKAASLQPANQWQMARNAAVAYSSDGDIAPRLLSALRPELKPILYTALGNLPQTEATGGQVIAFRSRASVYGHNAAASEMIAIRAVFELPQIEINSSSTIGTSSFYRLRLTFTIGSHSLTYPPPGQPALPLIEDEHEISFPDVGETITLLITPDEEGLFRLQFFFAKRPLTADAVTDINSMLNLLAEGSNPTSLRVERLGGQSDSGPEFIIQGDINGRPNPQTEQANVLWLDAQYEGIAPGSWVVVQRPSAPESNLSQTIIAQVTEVSEESRADYGLPGLKSTRLVLNQNWLNPDQDGFDVIRGTAVYVQSEELPLAKAPIDPVKEAVCGQAIDLDGLYDGLESGRWLIISGERTDIRPNEETNAISGIPATELVMLAGVEQVYDPNLPGETTHTRLHLANELAYCYKRDSVTIYGNVIKATHGETRREVLGSGDGSRAWQQFVLKKPPLTYLSASNPSGAESTLTVRVNDVRWQEADNHFILTPHDRSYTIEQDNEGQTAITFGDGRYGSRLPSGEENVTAVYRSGIGREGNVKVGADQACWPPGLWASKR